MNKEKILKILKNSLTVVVILALFIIVFYQNRDRDIFKFGRDESSGIKSSNQDSSAGYSEGILGKIDDKVALLTTTSYSISDQNGETESLDVAFTKPVMHTEGKYAVCYDLNTFDAVVFNENNEAYRIKTDNKIIMAKVNKNGYLFVTTEKDGYNCECMVYNRSGEPIFKWDVSKSEFIDGDVNPNNDAIVLSLASSGDNKLIGEIVHINITNANIIQKNTYESSVFFSVEFYHNGTYAALGNKNLKFFNTDGTEKWSYEYEDRKLSNADISNYDAIALAFSDRGELIDGNSAEVIVLNRLGQVLGQKTFEEIIDDISAGKNCIAVASDKKIFVITPELEEKKVIKTDYSIKKIEFFHNDSNVFVLGSSKGEILK